MGVVIPEGFAQVTVVMRGPGATKNSTWSLGLEEPVQTNMVLALTEWQGIITGTGNLCHADQMLVGWQYLGLDATYMTDTGPVGYSVSTTVTGVKDGAPVPVNSAFLITKRTNRGGRKGRGRVFFPPALFGESGIDGQGVINPASMTALNAVVNGTFDDLMASDHPPFLLHESADPPDEITAVTLQGQLATQRRRMR